jgi:hypothetical protein
MKAWPFFLLLFVWPGLVIASDALTVKKTPLNTAPVLQGKLPATAKAAKFELLKVFRPALNVYKQSIDYSVNNETKQMSITVYILNADIDRHSVIPGRSIRVDFPKSANVPGKITWVNEREFIWTSDAGVLNGTDYCDYKPDCNIIFTLTDDIKSKQGTKIDGDNDDKEGGNFVAFFIIMG